jgi:hypothetical protein
LSAEQFLGLEVQLDSSPRPEFGLAQAALVVSGMLDAEDLAVAALFGRTMRTQ